MDDPGLMGGLYGPGELFGELRGLSGQERGSAEPVGEGPPLDEFQDEIRQAAVFADLVNLDDVRVLHPGERVGFGEESSPTLGVGVDTGEQELDRHDPGWISLPGAVDDAHAPPAEFLKHLVTGRTPRLGRCELFQRAGVVVQRLANVRDRDELTSEAVDHGVGQPVQPPDRPLAFRADLEMRGDRLSHPLGKLAEQEGPQVRVADASGARHLPSPAGAGPRQRGSGRGPSVI